MTHYSNCSGRERLETLSSETESSQINKTQLFSTFKSIWQEIFKRLTKANEPQVWQSSDRLGKTCWHGYDPVTGHSVSRASEAEMRIWIEDRYYQ